MRRILLTLCALLVLWQHAECQTENFVSPSGLQTTIAEGLHAKGRFQGLELTDMGVTFSDVLVASLAHADLPSGFRVVMYTPLAWIKQQASNAGREYRSFTPSDITEDMRENVIRVRIYPSMPTYVSSSGTLLAKSVQHVVARDASRQRVVQPIRREAFSEEAQNAFGARVSYQGISAVFDLREIEKLRDDNEEFFLTVVVDRGERNFKIKRRHLAKLSFARIPSLNPSISARLDSETSSNPIAATFVANQAPEEPIRTAAEPSASYTAATAKLHGDLALRMEACLQALRRVDAAYKVLASKDLISAALIEAQLRFEEVLQLEDRNVLSQSVESAGFALQGFKEAQTSLVQQPLVFARDSLKSASEELDSYKTSGREFPLRVVATPPAPASTAAPPPQTKYPSKIVLK